MLSRRSVLAGAAGLAGIMALAPWTRGFTQQPQGIILCGATPGSVGSKLAEGTMKIITTQSGFDYAIKVIDRDSNRGAIREAKAAVHDGTALLQTQSGPLVLAPVMYRSMDYSIDDFLPISFLGEYTLGLFVGPAVPAQINSIDDYLRWVRQNPDFRDIGYTLNGSNAHLLAMLLGRIKVATTRPQAYRSTTSLFSDLQNQTLAAAFALSGVITQTSAPGVRLLAVTEREQDKRFSSIPTFAELGVQDMNMVGWFGWLAPKGTSAQTIQRLSDQAALMQKSEHFLALQRELLLKPANLTASQVTARMQAETAMYTRLIQAYGIPKIA